MKMENLRDIVERQVEIIGSLVELNKCTLDLLSQYMSVEEYEVKLRNILKGDDVII